MPNIVLALIALAGSLTLAGRLVTHAGFGYAVTHAGWRRGAGAVTCIAATASTGAAIGIWIIGQDPVAAVLFLAAAIASVVVVLVQCHHASRTQAGN